MKRLLVLAIIAALTGGCSTRYTKPGVSLAAAQHDLEECRYEAIKHSNGSTVVTAIYLVQQCMELRGYRSE